MTRAKMQNHLPCDQKLKRLWKNCQTEKSPGADQIPAELIKASGEEGVATQTVL